MQINAKLNETDKAKMTIKKGAVAALKQQIQKQLSRDNPNDQ